MPSFGKRSLRRLATCDQRLQDICHEAIEVLDFTVLEGHRNKEGQTKAFNEGKSQKQWPDSKHNSSPSIAVDLAPWPINWVDIRGFFLLAGVMFTIAHQKGIKIRWGGAFQGLERRNKSEFFDGPHFELIIED